MHFQILTPWQEIFNGPVGGRVPFPEVPDTAITPNNGTWSLTATSGHQYVPCSAELGDTSGERRPPAIAQTAELDFSEDVSIQTFVEQQSGTPLPDSLLATAEFDQPAPNIYHVADHSTEPPVEFALYVVSETEIVSSTLYWVEFSGETCATIVFNYWDFQG